MFVPLFSGYLMNQKDRYDTDELYMYTKHVHKMKHIRAGILISLTIRNHTDHSKLLIEPPRHFRIICDYAVLIRDSVSIEFSTRITTGHNGRILPRIS